MSHATRSATGTTPGPAVVTEDPELLDRLLRACAGAGITPDLPGDPATLRRVWATAGLVLVGSDRAAGLVPLGLGRRANVVVVTTGVETPAEWRWAVELGADQVLVLPTDEQRLIDLLSDVGEGGCRGLTLGVIGACGGAGASTLAAGLALTAADGNRRALLVDADPLGGGAQLVLGCEDTPGLRWPDLAATRGRVSAAALRSALPFLGSLPVLSWDTSGPRPIAPEALRGLVAAAQRGADLVVVDLPRQLDDPATQALRMCDVVALVVPAQVRGVAAARSLLHGLGAGCGDVHIVVRSVPHSDLSPDAVAGAFDHPLLGVVPTQRSVSRSVDEGLGPLGRGRLAPACRSILAALDRRG